MKKLFLTAASAAAILLTVCLLTVCLLTGCSAKESPDESVTETTASETEITTASETETEKTAETEETETETETEPVIGISGKFSADDHKGEKLLDRINNGFISYDKNEVTNLLGESGVTEKSLAENVESTNTNDCVYRFAMINDESAEEFDAGTETYFCSTLYIGDEEYLVIFGTDEYNTIEDVLPYCTENKLVEYWAYAYVDEDGLITLFPLIAGAEESGYYAVIPVFESLGMDVSGMEYPDKPLGRDYDPDSKTGEAADGEGTLNIKITGAENMDTMVSIDCTVKNTYSFDAIISGKTLTVNGEDFSDESTFYFEVKSGETLTDEAFYINDCALYPGDVIFVSANLMDGETYEDIGEVTFTFNLE